MNNETENNKEQLIIEDYYNHNPVFTEQEIKEFSKGWKEDELLKEMNKLLEE
jgi:hypothetical protein